MHDQTAWSNNDKAQPDLIRAEHVEGKSRKGHDKMTLDHPDGYEQPGPGCSLAVGKDEAIETPRCPESVKQVVSSRVKIREIYTYGSRYTSLIDCQIKIFRHVPVDK